MNGNMGAAIQKRVFIFCLCALMTVTTAAVWPCGRAAQAAVISPSILSEGIFAFGRAAKASAASALSASKAVPKPNASDPLATTPVVQIVKGALQVRYYSTSKAKFKLRAASANTQKYTVYNLYVNNATQRFALPAGGGPYIVQICENISGTRYRIKNEVTINADAASSAQPAAIQAPQAVTQTPQDNAAAQTATEAPQNNPAGQSTPVDPNDPFLASIEDVDWYSAVISVAKARELCASQSGNKAKAEVVYNYLVPRLSYDMSKYGKLSAGYLPVMDDTYVTEKGICYDIASLYAGMLRSAGVRAKLCMGYTSMVEGYHAWNEVDLGGGKWQTVDVTTDCQLKAYGKSVNFSKPQGTFSVTKSY